MKVYNIQWDQEKDDPTVLPREMEVPDWMRADDISDYITEKTGYCHFGFRIAKRGVEYYRKLGLTEERYNQMMKDFNSEQWIDEVINNWGIDNVNKGYAVFDFNCIGLFQIEAIVDVNAFYCDDDATSQAVNDGIKIIPVNELPSNFDRRYFGWIDTLENRKNIFEYCQNPDNYYCNGKSL